MYISKNGNLFGYACINTELSTLPKKDRIITNRSMIKKTFDERGIQYSSELSLENVKDLAKIVNWNHKKGIKFFRVSSEIFPWSSEYSLEDLPNFSQIKTGLELVGNLSRKYDQRLTFHPGPFNKLSSNNDVIVKNTIKDLETHGKIFDLMGFSKTHYNKINIHVGAAYDDKKKALYDFNKNLDKLSDSVRNRITVENDDKESLYSTKELYNDVYKVSQVPIVFDFHHHKFCNGGQTEEEALSLALSTWGSTKPVVHYSESRSDEYKQKCKPQAHSDFIYNKINNYNLKFDCMIEAKMKEVALIKYFHQHEMEQV